MKSPTDSVDIEAILRGCGVKSIATINPLEFENAVEAVKVANEFNGVSVVIFKYPCIALFPAKTKFEITEKCIKCKKCIREIGCPAIRLDDNGVKIDSSLCHGCGLCAQICPVDAIKEGK